MRASGFTLLELMVAIVVTGVVAVVVYGTMGVALGAESRVALQRDAVQQDLAFRAVLTEALRTVRLPDIAQQRTFLVEEWDGTTGPPRDRLWFVASGGTAPFTADADWSVTLQATDDGLILAGVPEGAAAAPPTALALPGVTGLQAEVLVPGRVQPRLPGAIASLPAPPALVRLTFWDSAGPAGPPLLVAPRVGVTP